jgi:hypothetical protein
MISYRRIITLLVLLLLVLWTNPLYSQVMQGGQYQINSDSLNFGGKRSSSGSYLIEDTLGEISSGNSTSTNFNLYAGYQQMNMVFLSATPASDVTMTPSIAGLSGGTANGTTSLTVTTDNFAGYEISLKASTSPALKSSSDSFDDYVPAGSPPDYNFTFGSSASVFGYNVFGNDIYQMFKNNGSVCNAGTNITNQKCWKGFATTSYMAVQGTTNNQPSGTQTSILLKAGSGSSAYLTEGTYQGEIILTILPR